MHTVYYVMQYDSSSLTQTYTGKIPSSIFVLDEDIYSSIKSQKVQVVVKSPFDKSNLECYDDDNI